VIVDDECYLTLDGNEWTENDWYFDCEYEDVPKEVKTKLLEKFPPRIMVWLSISSRGRSEAYFVPSKLGVNREVYSNECIRKRLVSYIKQYHGEGDYIFWSDLAPAHYANDTQTAMNELGIKFVAKKDNPPAVPQIRSIEKFWANFERRIFENGWTAKIRRESEENT
jgi:hypothetical protein